MESVPWEKLESLFSGIAEILKKGGEHFWPLVIRQQYINGLFSLGLVIVMIGGSYFVAKWCRKKLNEKDSYDDEWYAIGIGTSVVVGLLGLIPLFYAISMLVNPEWWALVALSNLVK